MTQQLLRAVAAAFALTLLAGTAVAQEGVGSHACASVVEDSARLACYDAAFGRPAAGAAPARVPVAKAREEFGLTEAEKRARDPAKAEAHPESITGRVASVGRRPGGELLVTLSDGQVWTQVEAGTNVFLKEGDEITIRKAALGSYLLVTPKRVAIRVRRVK